MRRAPSLADHCHQLHPVQKTPKNAANGKATQEFFRWVYKNGDAQARQLDYVPLPDSLVRQIETYWSQNLK